MSTNSLTRCKHCMDVRIGSAITYPCSAGVGGAPYSLRADQSSTGPLEEGVDVTVDLETKFTSLGEEATVQVRGSLVPRSPQT